MTRAQTEEALREISAALKRSPTSRLRARLVAIEMLLRGEPMHTAAASARVRPNTVNAWLRTLTYEGIRRMLARWEGRGDPRPRRLDADPVALCRLAAKEKNLRVRRRMLALACVAEGMSPHAAGLSARLNGTVSTWIERFQAEGIAGLPDRTITGRPPRLNHA